jgi:hypothetical protein
MAYFKAKLKSSGDRASPCFRPFWIGKLSDKCLPIRTLLYAKLSYSQQIYQVLCESRLHFSYLQFSEDIRAAWMLGYPSIALWPVRRPYVPKGMIKSHR